MSLENQIFQRCPHDKENPYTMISRDLIRDQSISPECRWLIIYLLANKDDWQINLRQIINHCEGHIGRDKVYAIVNEALEAGYMMREESLDSGKKRYKYFVSESPKFKKSLLFPENQDTEIQYTENQDTKERASGKDKHIKDTPISPKKGKMRSRRKKVDEEKHLVAPEVYLTKTQIDALKMRLENDGQKELAVYRKLSDWKIGKQITGGNDYLQMTNWVIKRVEEDFSKPTPVDRTAKHKEIADQIRKKFSSRMPHDIEITYKQIIFKNGRDEVTVGFGDAAFEEIIENNLRKRGLSL